MADAIGTVVVLVVSIAVVAAMMRMLLPYALVGMLALLLVGSFGPWLQALAAPLCLLLIVVVAFRFMLGMPLVPRRRR